MNQESGPADKIDSPRREPRLPPGQVKTDKWPVLHYGDVHRVDTRNWTFEVTGLVDRPFTLAYDDLMGLPRKTVVCDMHCVTRWSRLDNTFEGVAVQDEPPTLDRLARRNRGVTDGGFGVLGHGASLPGMSASRRSSSHAERMSRP